MVDGINSNSVEYVKQPLDPKPPKDDAPESSIFGFDDEREYISSGPDFIDLDNPYDGAEAETLPYIIMDGDSPPEGYFEEF